MTRSIAAVVLGLLLLSPTPLDVIDCHPLPYEPSNTFTLSAETTQAAQRNVRLCGQTWMEPIVKR